MRILLIGEYSNVHATLAEGLRTLGHQVTVASNGDFWKNYPRDVDLSRPEGRLGGVQLMMKVACQLPHWRGYDIVQLINPMFLELKAERITHVYQYLRKHNRKLILCALGMDWYWVNECITRKPLRYSDFNIGDKLRTDEPALTPQRDWLGTAKGRLNQFIAQDCDHIVTGLYEYHVCYEPYFPQKTTFIPLPIKMPSQAGSTATNHPLHVFIGISRERSSYKGTDIMLRAAEDLQAKYPNDMELIKVEGVPFNEYQRLMDGSDIILDQLYSYTPSMNPLLAMSKGIIVVGGGEPENYDILGEQQLRPIINVQPTYASVYEELESLLKSPNRLPELKRQSMAYVQKHHDHIKVAKAYEHLYLSLF